jgi:hypothetical protein
VGRSIQCSLDLLNIEENQPANFDKWNGLIALLMLEPPNGWPTRFVKKRIEKTLGINKSGRLRTD